MNSKVSSLEEKVKLPPTETISRCYQPQGGGNRKVIRILTVAVYVLCVSLAAIMLSLYYIFIWDPTIRPFVTKSNNCEKIVIPEKIAIRLLNSSEVTAEQFYRHILEQYRILNQLQQQRQQFLQKQHIQLQQLAAANKFQEIFATATIIQSNLNDRIKVPITPTNGTFLLAQTPPTPSSASSSSILLSQSSQQAQQQPHAIVVNDFEAVEAAAEQPQPPQSQQPQLQQQQTDLEQQQMLPMVPILDTIPAIAHAKRKSHRKHSNNNNNNNNHHKHNTRKAHKKLIPTTTHVLNGETEGHHHFMETPLNPPALVLQESSTSYTPNPMPIPLILNSKEEKHSHHSHADRKSGNSIARRRTASSSSGSATVSAYDAQTYLNPFLTGELIFEK